MYSDSQEMLEIIRKTFPTFQRVEDAPNDTSKGWKVPGFLGQVWFSEYTFDQLEIIDK